jgi:hypothetical protein
VVPINTRLSAVEINHVLADATPRDMLRHAALTAPAGRVPLKFVVDQGHLDGGSGLARSRVMNPTLSWPRSTPAAQPATMVPAPR